MAGVFGRLASSNFFRFTARFVSGVLAALVRIPKRKDYA
jgi:hypothetical protein